VEDNSSGQSTGSVGYYATSSWSRYPMRVFRSNIADGFEAEIDCDTGTGSIPRPTEKC
jgi:ABC-type uncharacterized transport system auxiliary subunit